MTGASDNSSRSKRTFLVKKVIYGTRKDCGIMEIPILISFPDMIQLGKDYEKNHPGLYEELSKTGRRGDCTDLLHLRTTGCPKEP